MRWYKLITGVLMLIAVTTTYDIQLNAEPVHKSVSSVEDKAAETKARRESLIQPYEKTTTLSEAIEVLKGQLSDAGVAQYLPLLTTESVQHAIYKSIASLEKRQELSISRAKTKEQLQSAKRGQQNFRELCEPLVRHMADSGNWIPASYFSFVRRDENYSNVSIKLHISAEHETSLGIADGYAIQILSVNYGIEAPSEFTTTLKYNYSSSK